MLSGMGSNLFVKAGDLISAISPLFAAGFGVYILIVVLNAYGRGLDENVVDLAKRGVGWVIIIACAFNASQYGHIAQIAFRAPEELAGLFGTGAYTASAIDAAWNNIMEFVEKMSAYSASINGIGFGALSDKILINMGTAVILILAGIFFMMVMAFYLVAKISLALVLMIGPLFLGCLLFPATRQYGMNWIGQVLNYMVTIAFFVILGAFQMQFFTKQMASAINGEASSALQLLGIIPIFLIGTVLFGIVAWNVPSIASALTGGAMASGFSNFARTVLSGKAPALYRKGTPKDGGKITAR